MCTLSIVNVLFWGSNDVRPVASKALECLQCLNPPGSPVKRSPREEARLDISPHM